MAVYRKNILPEGMPVKPLVTGAIVLVLLILFLTAGSGSDALSAELVKNPLSLSQNDSTILRVRVSCPCTQAQQNIVVNVDAPAAPQLGIYPQTRTILSLGPSEYRTLEFLVTPVDTPNNPFLPGKYTILIRTRIENKNYELLVYVNVEK